MAAIPSTSGQQSGDVVVNKITLGASDTLTYTPNGNQYLMLHNTTAGSLTATIDGNGGTTVPIPGTGATFDVSSGKAVTVAAGVLKMVKLDSISAYLQGTVAVTGGTGLIAWIITV